MKRLRDPYSRVFAGLLLLYVLVFTTVSFLRVDTLKTYLNDLGNMDQAVWASSEGHILHQSNTGDGLSLVRFYEHFDPILLAFVPFYWIIPSAKWLLLIQTLALAAGAVPVFLLARERLSARAALVMSLAYLLYPALGNANLYDFHPVALAAPVLAFMIWAAEKERMGLYWLLVPLLLTIKEEMPLILMASGCYLCVRRQWKHGIASLVLGAVVFLVIMKVIIPWFSPVGGHPLLAAQEQVCGSGYTARYAWLGSSVGEIMVTLVTRPFYVVRELLSADRIFYVVSLFFPVLFLPFLSPVLLIALPTMGINMLSANDMMYNLFFYHSVAIVPVIFLAATDVLAAIQQRNRLLVVPLLVGIAAVSFVFHMSQSLLPYSIAPLRYTLKDLVIHDEYRVLRKIVKTIPREASVSVQQNLGVFFSQRLNVYRFPLKAGETEYVVLYITNPNFGDHRSEKYLYALQMPFENLIKWVYSLVTGQGYGVVTYDKGFLVLKKGYTNPDSLAVIGQIAGGKTPEGQPEKKGRP